MRAARLAEVVADSLRSQILLGGISAGRLPPQAELLKQFKVGLPSIREAFRILEAEGLISVQRGNVGGATVHRPGEATVAYTVAMVLESESVPLAAVGDALHRFEPMCAAMCSQLEDRGDVLVPALRDLVKGQRDAVGEDELRFNALARDFHTVIVRGCGNAPMALTIGSLVKVWTAHEQSWTESALSAGRFPGERLQHAIVDVHEKILKAVEVGDAGRAERLATAHLDAAQTYHLSVDGRPHVVCAPLRHGARAN